MKFAISMEDEEDPEFMIASVKTNVMGDTKTGVI
jgi:hypothetical protein